MIQRATLLGAAAALALGPGLAWAEGHEGERGRDGQLDIIYWQAPTTLNVYLSGGLKELESSSLIVEPLVRFDENGELVPLLVDEIPDVGNGGVAEDLTSITWTLSEGITWSDGSPLTGDDVVFTWEYCTHPDFGCAWVSFFEGVKSVEALDERKVKVTFSDPKPYPYTAFVGSASPILQRAQFGECLGARAPECTEANFNPIGTGPFKVDEFRPGDVITLSANENYREAGKPAFAGINLKGGGDAAGAARSVLETGEFDYAWNLQIAPEVLAEMERAGNGKVVAAFGATVERILLNQTDPDPSLGEDKRSVYDDGNNPHPFLTDPAVGRALSMAIDRDVIVEVGYGPGGQPTCNILPAPPAYASSANNACLEQDIEGAKAILEEAGWTDGDGDGIREKDGQKLSLLYQTSTNAVRQDVQALVKQWWSEIGVETELRHIDPAEFFGSDPASPNTFIKFHADVEMFANGYQGVDPEAYFGNWRCSEIPGPASQWQGRNIHRICDPAYEALLDEMSSASDLDKRGELAMRLNDILVQNYAMIPLVHRGNPSAHVNSLGGVKMSDWDSELWNVADWYRKAE